MKEWRAILRKIAKGFEAGRDLSQMNYRQKRKHDRLQKEFDEGFKLFKEYFFNLWD